LCDWHKCLANKLQIKEEAVNISSWKKLELWMGLKLIKTAGFAKPAEG